MAFRVQVFKQITGSDREWSNTWRMDATDLAAAVTAADAIVSGEQLLHADNVSLTRMRVSDEDPSTDVFQIVPLNILGTAYAASEQDQLPLFNTVRVDISVVGGGRPSRKYYRPPLNETWQTNMEVVGAIQTLFTDTVNAILANVVTAGGTLVDPDGQVLDNATTFAKVQMRQLHRKRRKATPAP